jgi:hypothetical protein
MEYLMLFDSLASMYVVFTCIDLSNYLFSVLVLERSVFV